MDVKLFELTKPLWIFSQICGLFPGFGSLDGKFDVFVYILKVYTAFVFCANFYLLVTYPSLDLTIESDHIVFLTDSLCSLINNMTLLICICYNWSNLKKINWISVKLYKIGVLFQSDITYNSSKSLVVIALCVSVFSWWATLLTLKLVYEEWFHCMCDWFEFYFSSNVTDVHTIQFLFFLHLLKTHLSVIKGKLQNLKGAPSKTYKKLEVLTFLKKYHRKLFKIFNAVNDVFSVPLLFTVANIFIAMFAELYFSTNGRALYNRSIFRPKNFSDFLITLTVFCKLTLKLITITKMCENVYLEQRDISWILHGIKSEKRDAVFDRKLIDFSLQLIHEKMTFTAAGFFTLDNSLLRTVFSAVTIYLVILIQFDMSTTKKGPM